MADADPFDAAIDAALKGGAAAPSQPAPAAAPASAPVDPFDSAIDDALAGKVAAPAAAKPVRPQIPLSEVPADIVNSGAQGAIYGTLAGIPSTLRTVRDLGARGQNWLIAHGAATLGMLPEGKTAHDLFNDLNGLDAQSAGRGEDAALGPTFEQAKALPDYLTGGEYQPKSVLGDYAKTVGEFAPFAGSAMLKAAVIPGITSETAGQLTKGTDWEPWARLGGAVVGGGAAGLAAPAVGAAVNKAKLAVEPMLNPERAAARELAATTPNIDAVDRLTSPGPMRPGEVPQYDPVAGVTPTTGAIANSPALRAAGQDAPELLQRERELRTGSDKDAISGLVAQDQANSAARTAALSNVQASGSPADVAARFRQLRDEADQQAQVAVADAAPAAEAADSAIGGTSRAETIGGAIRQPVEDARAAAKANENKLWGLVRDDLSVPSGGIADAANSVKGELSPSARPMTGEEARIFDVAAQYGAAMPFSELRDLRSSITDAAAEARQAGNTQTARRLGILRQSVDDALDHGIENQAALDQISVNRGTMAPEQSLGARIDAVAAGGSRGVRTSAESGGVGVPVAPMVAGGANARFLGYNADGLAVFEMPNGRRAVKLANGMAPMEAPNMLSGPGFDGGYERPAMFEVATPRAAGGRSRVSSAGPAYAPEPEDLVGFLKRQGGLAPTSDLDAMELGKRYPGLIKPNGRNIDNARELAAEAGYFGADTARHVAETTPNDLLNALDSDGKVYSELDQEQAAQHFNYKADRARQADYKNAEQSIQKWAAENGETPTNAELRDAARIMVDDGKPWDSALESAYIRSTEGARDREIFRGRTSGNGEGPSQAGAAGNGPRAQGGTVSAGANGRIYGETGQGASGSHFFETATPEDIAAYKAAKDATRERAQTFDEGLPGDILKPAPRGGYKTVDAAVIDKVVPRGKNTDATNVQQYLNAGGSPEALADGIAYKIRKECSYPDGTLNPAKVQAYIRNPANREALAQLPPEYAQRFANAATTREAVENAQAAQIQAQKDFNQTALARVADLHDGADVVKTVGGIFGQQGAVAKMRELANAAKGDPAATEGLRRAIIEHMEQRLTSNLEGNAIKGSSYLGFVDKNGDVLRQVFTPAEMGRFHAIGESIDTAGRIHTTKGLTSSPGTAQDVAAHGPRIMGALMDELGPATAAAAAHMAGMGEIGSAAAWLGSKTLGRLKAAGLAKRDALINEAVTNPHAFRALMAKMPAKPDQGTAAALGHQLAVIASRASAADLSAQQGR